MLVDDIASFVAFLSVRDESNACVVLARTETDPSPVVQQLVSILNQLISCELAYASLGDAEQKIFKRAPLRNAFLAIDAQLVEILDREMAPPGRGLAVVAGAAAGWDENCLELLRGLRAFVFIRAEAASIYRAIASAGALNAAEAGAIALSLRGEYVSVMRHHALAPLRFAVDAELEAFSSLCGAELGMQLFSYGESIVRLHAAYTAISEWASFSVQQRARLVEPAKQAERWVREHLKDAKSRLKLLRKKASSDELPRLFEWLHGLWRTLASKATLLFRPILEAAERAAGGSDLKDLLEERIGDHAAMLLRYRIKSSAVLLALVADVTGLPSYACTGYACPDPSEEDDVRTGMRCYPAIFRWPLNDEDFSRHMPHVISIVSSTDLAAAKQPVVTYDAHFDVAYYYFAVARNTTLVVGLAGRRVGVDKTLLEVSASLQRSLNATAAIDFLRKGGKYGS